MIRDVEDRWIQARRIWNQHTYHVTNVREDGTIPQHEPPHWEALNTFRTQRADRGRRRVPAAPAELSRESSWNPATATLTAVRGGLRPGAQVSGASTTAVP